MNVISLKASWPKWFKAPDSQSGDCRFESDRGHQMKQWIKDIYFYICECEVSVNDLQVFEHLNFKDRYRVAPQAKVPPTPNLKEFIRTISNETVD